MSKELPDLHKQAFKFKNTKKLQHDGGRAWIRDSQLHESRKDGNGRLVTTGKKLKPSELKPEGDPEDVVKSI